MKRRRDRDFWVKRLEEANHKLFDLVRKVAYLEQALSKNPLKPLNRRMWGRTRQPTSKARRVSFAKFKMIHIVRSTSLAKTRREVAKTKRQVEHCNAMIAQSKLRANVWWRLKNPLV